MNFMRMSHYSENILFCVVYNTPSVALRLGSIWFLLLPPSVKWGKKMRCLQLKKQSRFFDAFLHLKLIITLVKQKTGFWVPSGANGKGEISNPVIAGIRQMTMMQRSWLSEISSIIPKIAAQYALQINPNLDIINFRFEANVGQYQ